MSACGLPRARAHGESNGDRFSMGNGGCVGAMHGLIDGGSVSGCSVRVGPNGQWKRGSEALREAVHFMPGAARGPPNPPRFPTH